MQDEKATAVLAIDQGIAVLAIMGARFNIARSEQAHIPPAVAIRGCNTFREKTKLSKIS